jgi:transposase
MARKNAVEVVEANLTETPEAIQTTSEPTMTSRIKALLADGNSVADIAKALDVRYQLVYQTMKRTGQTFVPANRARVPVVLTNEDGVEIEMSRAEAIRTLSSNGMAVGKIAKELNCTYQTVYQTVKKANEANLTVEDQLAESEEVPTA